MSARSIRRGLAAGITALALVAVGAGAASAADEVPSSNLYGGSPYLWNNNTWSPIDTSNPVTLGYGDSIAAVAAPGLSDPTASAGVFPIPAGTSWAFTFIAPQGQEADRSKWNASFSLILTSGGIVLPNVTPSDLATPEAGNPGNTSGVAATGGAYSLGIAFLDDAYHPVEHGLIYGHIQVTSGTLTTASYVFTPTTQAAAPTATPTISTYPSSVLENTAFDLTATLDKSNATGTVEFFNGATSLGSAPVNSGSATLHVASGLAAGTASITAVYSGDGTYPEATSAPVTITVSAPQGTTTVVEATSANNNYALEAVTLKATITAGQGTPTGTVDFSGTKDGSTYPGLPTNVAVVNGVATATVNGLAAGTYVINAAFHGTGVFQNSSSTTPATLVLVVNNSKHYETTPDGTSKDVTNNVNVTIPAGALIITTPYSNSNPFSLNTARLDAAQSTWWASGQFGSATDPDQQIKIIDTRAGDRGFEAELQSTDFVSGASDNQKFSAAHAGLVGVTPTYVTGNAIQANVVPTDIPANTPGLASAHTFAKYSAGQGIGSVGIKATFEVRDVETSILPGLYQATLTFDVF